MGGEGGTPDESNDGGGGGFEGRGMTETELTTGRGRAEGGVGGVGGAGGACCCLGGGCGVPFCAVGCGRGGALGDERTEATYAGRKISL